jgi:UDP-4-amino-4-deoxy-L-arabinose-oxoglutarate aminotransferase
VGKNNRDIVLSKLSENRIGATVNYRSITTMNFYQKKYSFQSSRFINSENWGEGTLSIPLFESLKPDEIQYVIDTLVNEVTPMIGSKHNV